MKSAYELAMERLEKESPSAKLTDAQKAELADIDSTYKARIAERELFLKDNIVKALAEGKFHDVAELEDQLAREVRRLSSECEDKKERARRARA